MKSVSDAQNKRIIADAFERADEEHCGHLTREDVRVACIELFGFRPSNFELDNLFAKAPARRVDLQVFTDFTLPRLQAPRHDDLLRQAFTVLDTDCKHFLTLRDLERAVRQSAPKFPQKALEVAFKETDSDGDGRVSFRDFERVLKFGLAE